MSRKDTGDLPGSRLKDDRQPRAWRLKEADELAA
jgi:hypothetical protein